MSKGEKKSVVRDADAVLISGLASKITIARIMAEPEDKNEVIKAENSDLTTHYNYVQRIDVIKEFKYHYAYFRSWKTSEHEAASCNQKYFPIEAYDKAIELVLRRYVISNKKLELELRLVFGAMVYSIDERSYPVNLLPPINIEELTVEDGGGGGGGLTLSPPF